MQVVTLMLPPTLATDAQPLVLPKVPAHTAHQTSGHGATNPRSRCHVWPRRRGADAEYAAPDAATAATGSMLPLTLSQVLLSVLLLSKVLSQVLLLSEVLSKVLLLSNAVLSEMMR